MEKPILHVGRAHYFVFDPVTKKLVRLLTRWLRTEPPRPQLHRLPENWKG